MIDEQSFYRAAEEALEAVRRALLPAADEHEFEVDYDGGALAIEFEEPARAKFVISPNAPARQVWVSALSKSFKLEWSQEKGTFVWPQSGETLKELTGRVVGRQLGEPVALP